MPDSASFTSGIAGRYATALFELASDAGQIDTLESDADALLAALSDSADLSAMIASPIYSRDEQQAAITEVAKAMGLSDLTRNTAALMAAKRRLFALPQTLRQVKQRIADARGEVTAEVTVARPLSDAQSAKLAETIAGAVGRTVKIETHVDESLIGGLVVKVGSRMVDTSIKAKLAALQTAMKEVG